MWYFCSLCHSFIFLLQLADFLHILIPLIKFGSQSLQKYNHKIRCRDIILLSILVHEYLWSIICSLYLGNLVICEPKILSKTCWSVLWLDGNDICCTLRLIWKAAAWPITPKGLHLHTFVFDAPFLWNFLVSPCVYGGLGHDFSVGSTGYMVLTMIKNTNWLVNCCKRFFVVCILLIFLYFTTAVLLQWKCSIWDFVVVWFVH